MATETRKLTQRVTLRLTPGDFQQLQMSFRSTTKRKFSEYLRALLLHKSVTVYTRDQSLDDTVAELTCLRKELSAIGNNFNQLVKKLNAARFNTEVEVLARTAEKEQEKFLSQVSIIKGKIALISERWLQE